MAKYRIEYSQKAADEFRKLRRIERVVIADAITRHLQDAPDRETGSSIKKLDPPLLAEFRLRVREYRVFYDVDIKNRVVVIAAIRYKGRLTLEEAAYDQSN